ncbi:hypothetical protein M422DRAFT_24001 [Sphaerobolus stellatus SS14]|nr:hypothetical protein M422DRAFT_24001 [Sphaerobolus stellatus SS14]
MSARPSRTRTQATSYTGDSDSEPSDIEDTPKPKKGSKKKRISDVFSASGEEPLTRTPLGSMNLNDDAAEKRKRRKSFKVAAPTLDDIDAPRPSEPQAQAKANPLNVIEDAPPVKVPLDVMSSNFEEWMKMATDNKINPANSWNFALIDYFHDMSLLRNMTDNSINFQKASCTLDGCVKIWTSRVESVGTETFKLVSDLASGGNRNDSAIDAEDEDDPSADGSKKRAKAHRPEATLAKNASQLRSKKLELEFAVDPLFKKTCADFDESGAQGLLMNHLALGLGGSLRVVFDASDSAGAVGGEDDEEPEEPEDLIDMSYLRKQFIPSLDILEDKAISHSLEGFSFQKDAFDFNDATLLETANLQLDDDDDDDFGGDDTDMTHADHPPDFGADITGNDVQDFFVGDQAVNDDYGDFGGDDMGDSGEGGMYVPAQGNEPGSRPMGAFEPFDPRRVPNERDLVMAMTSDDAEGGMMDYFDQNFLKNWAGPEHWKLRKAVRKVVEASETAAPKAKREKKEAFRITFSEPLETPIADTFAPATGRGGGIDLPVSKTWASRSQKSKGKGKGRKNSKEEKEVEIRSNQTLPDDMHFSSRQLVTLFLKPNFSLKMRGRRVRINEDDGEVDENFWAQAAADQAAGLHAADVDETADDGGIPFNTQFFHDDYDDGPGFDDVYEGDAPGPAETSSAEDQDLLAATQGQGRRVRPEFVNYAKRAKRVDVRKLKENIWKGLNIVVSHGQKDDEDVSMASEPPTDPSEARTFETVISDLKETYPREKMEEISTSFCFICLLHLANEQGLKIEVEDKGTGVISNLNVGDGSTDDPKGDSRGVGDLWGLKVYRDPDATPAA